jgi:hypothetical protein
MVPALGQLFLYLQGDMGRGSLRAGFGGGKEQYRSNHHD